MLTLRQVQEGADVGPAPVVALGTFDGVHLAHQAILQKAVALARRLGGTPVAFTFDRHPAEALGRGPVPQLTSLEDKLDLLAASGAEVCVVATFDEAFSRQEARDFIDGVLVRALKARGVVCGFDFRFGRGALGNPALLREAGRESGFQVEVLEPVVAGGTTVSSTEIRRRLAAGDVEGAAELLGRHYAVRGRVVPGHGKGRELGFPTANLRVEGGVVLPADGVYYSWVGRPEAEGQDRFYPALAVVSSRPTFGDNPRGLEVHILDFSGDVYGERLTIHFQGLLRGIVPFPSVEALQAQISQDVAAARARFMAAAKQGAPPGP